MPSQNAPEFNQPSRGKHQPKPGDTVSFRDLKGEERVGKITDSSPGGTFDVVSAGITYYRRAEEMFPIRRSNPPGSSKPNTGSSHTPQSIAKHLAAGGEAFYVPNAKRYGPDAGKLDLQDGRNEPERVPLHSVWFGDEKNLVDLVNFDDVAAGSASIDLGPASPPKQKAARPAHPLDRLSDTEVSTFIRSGASKAFDGVPAEDRAQKHGGHSIDSLLGDRKSATKENVSSFVSAMRGSRENSNLDAIQVVQDAGGLQRATETASPSEMAAAQVQAAREDARRERDESDPEQASSGHGIDAVQTTLDGVGLAGDAVVPGSGVAADGTSAIVSLIRAASDPKNAGEHLRNAAISTVSMVPFVGDLAKVFKYGPKAARAANAAKVAGRAGNAPGGPGDIAGLVSQIIGGGSGGDQETERAGGGGNNGSDGPPTGRDDSGQNGTGDADDDPLSGRSANVKDTVFEFGSVVGKASAATLTAANSISLMNKAAIEYHRDLVQYNGVIAEAYGELESERAHRSIERGRDLSGSLSGLVESQSKLEEKLQDFSSPWKVLGADISRILTEILAVGVAILDFLEPFSEAYADYVRPSLVRLGILKGPVEATSSGWFGKIQKDFEDNAKKPRKV